MVKRFLVLIMAVLAVAACHAQVQTISSTRLDELKIKMPLDSVNKLLGSKIHVKAAGDYYNSDTVWVNYKNDSVRLIFATYTDEKKVVASSLQNIYCAGKNLKTKSGIKPGDNKFDLIKKLDGSSLRIAPDWHYENTADKKLYSTVVLYDYTNETFLTFYFYNNILYAFECGASQDEC